MRAAIGGNVSPTKDIDIRSVVFEPAQQADVDQAIIQGLFALRSLRGIRGYDRGVLRWDLFAKDLLNQAVPANDIMISAPMVF